MAFNIPASLTVPAVMLMQEGARHQIADELRSRNLHRPLFVSDATMESLGLLADVRGPLDDGNFDTERVLVADRHEPTDESIAPVVAALEKHSADALIALGGGSVIDSAKAAAVLHAHGGAVRDYRFPTAIPPGGVPVFAVPTTAGTGSEATAATVITDVASGEKLLLMGPNLVPEAAIVDYTLSMSQPRRLTADTGLDALTHAIESYVSRKATGDTRVVAAQAMRAIFDNLKRAYDDGDDGDARREMMHGATLAGIAFSNASVALVHGMSRPIGARFHVPHGLSNAMLLPAVTAFSLRDAPRAYGECARIMGLADESRSDHEAGRILAEALQVLAEDLQVPGLEAFGIERAEFLSCVADMAAQALASGSPANNPRQAGAGEIADLYCAIYDRVPLQDIVAL